MADLRHGGPSFWADQIRGADADIIGGAVVENGASVTVTAGPASVTGTASVEDDEFSGVSLPATAAIVQNGNSFTAADGGTITVAVAAGVPTFTYTAP